MKLRTTLLALLVAALPMGVFADGHEDAPPAMSDVWVMAPKADQEDAFYESMASYMAWRAEVGDSRTWLAYTPIIGDKMNRVMFRSNFSAWADQDAYQAEAVEKGYGEKFNEMVAAHVDHYHRYIDEYDYENSHWTDSPKGPFYGVTTWYLSEDFTPQAYEARKKLSELGKDGWANEKNEWLWITPIGGALTLAIVTPYSSWADMAEPEYTFFEHIVEKVGEEEAGKLFADFSAGKVKSDYTVWRHVEEISSVQDED